MKPGYFKWTFTRWHFYIVWLGCIINTAMNGRYPDPLTTIITTMFIYLIAYLFKFRKEMK